MQHEIFVGDLFLIARKILFPLKRCWKHILDKTKHVLNSFKCADSQLETTRAALHHNRFKPSDSVPFHMKKSDITWNDFCMVGGKRKSKQQAPCQEKTKTHLQPYPVNVYSNIASITFNGTYSHCVELEHSNIKSEKHPHMGHKILIFWFWVNTRRIWSPDLVNSHFWFFLCSSSLWETLLYLHSVLFYHVLSCSQC